MSPNEIPLNGFLLDIDVEQVGWLLVSHFGASVWMVSGGMYSLKSRFLLALLVESFGQLGHGMARN